MRGDLTEALAPVRRALTEAAWHDAERTRAAARADAERVTARAHQRAEQILAEARARGSADAAAALTAARARARRDARGAVLRARNEAYRRLHERGRSAIAALAAEPGYPVLLERLSTVAARELGPSVRVHEAAGGGVTAETAGRRVDFTLSRLADRALDVVARQLDAELEHETPRGDETHGEHGETQGGHGAAHGGHGDTRGGRGDTRGGPVR